MWDVIVPEYDGAYLHCVSFGFTDSTRSQEQNGMCYRR